MQHAIVHRDAHEILRDQFARCDPLLRQRGLHFGDGRFHDAKRGLAVRMFSLRLKRADGEKRDRENGSNTH